MNSTNFYAFYGATAGGSLTIVGMVQQIRSHREARSAITAVVEDALMRLRFAGAAGVLTATASFAALATTWDAWQLRAIVCLTIFIALMALVDDLVPRDKRQLVRRAGQAHPRLGLKIMFAVVLVALGVAVGAVLTRSTAPDSPLVDYTPKTFYVHGTCASGACGLNPRAHPRRYAAKKGRPLADGSRIGVLCQIYGGPVSAPGHRRSLLWDLLKDGTWVSDLFVSTSKRGYTSRDVPRCSPALAG
jgi:hypothetical protein